MNYFSISTGIIYSGAGLALLIAASELALYLKHSSTEKNDYSVNPYVIWIGLIVFSLQLRIGLFLEKTDSYWLYFTLFASIYLAGPVMLRMLWHMLKSTFNSDIPDFPLKKLFKSPLTCLPVLPVTIIEFLFQMQDQTEKEAIMGLVYTKFSFHSIDLGILLGILLNIFYFSLLTWILFHICKRYSVKNRNQILSIVSLPLIALIFFMPGFLLKSLPFIHFGSHLITLTFILAFIYMRNYPNFFLSMLREIEKQRYVRTQLTGLDIPSVLKQLETLMHKEKIYRDPDLRLSLLSDELSISSHQLSRILNENFNQNFNTFINSFRIQEACEILATEPERTIISVAFDTGFNTKSSFNDQFLRHTGMSPKQFKEQEDKNRS